MIKLVAFAAFAAALICGTARSYAQDWKDVACEDTGIVVPAALKDNARCMQGPPALSNDARSSQCKYFSYMLRVKTPGRDVPYFVWSKRGSESSGCYMPHQMKSQDLDAVKAYDAVTKVGKDWGEIKEIDDVRTVQFEAQRGNRCLGFTIYGPQLSAGHVWATRGYYCDPLSKPSKAAFTEAEIRDRLALVKLK